MSFPNRVFAQRGHDGPSTESTKRTEICRRVSTAFNVIEGAHDSILRHSECSLAVSSRRRRKSRPLTRLVFSIKRGAAKRTEPSVGYTVHGPCVPKTSPDGEECLGFVEQAATKSVSLARMLCDRSLQKPGNGLTRRAPAAENAGHALSCKKGEGKQQSPNHAPRTNRYESRITPDVQSKIPCPGGELNGSAAHFEAAQREKA